MEHDNKQLKIACKHYESKIYKTCFFQWNLYIQKIQREREEEREAALRKAKIDELMNAVKEKAKKENQKPVITNVLEVPERIPVRLRSSSRSSHHSRSDADDLPQSPRSGRSMDREEYSPPRRHSPRYKHTPQVSEVPAPTSPVKRTRSPRHASIDSPLVSGRPRVTIKQKRSPRGQDPSQASRGRSEVLRSPRSHSKNEIAAQPNAPRQTKQAEPQTSAKGRKRRRPVTKPPPPEVTAMQQRQEERKRKREELNKQYQEKKEAEDKLKAERDEQSAAELKRKKREAYLKKKQEAEEKQRMREEKQAFIESLRTKYETARAFNNEQIMYRCGIEPLKTYLAQVKRAKAMAVIKGRIAIQKYTFKLFRSALKICVIEKEAAEEEREVQATQWYLNQLKMHSFNAIIQEYIDSTNQGETASGNRNRYLLKQALSGWVSIRPNLRKELKAQLEQECYIIHQFKLLTHGPRILQRLKANAEGNKLSRLREEHNAQMWNKVQGWLDES